LFLVQRKVYYGIENTMNVQCIKSTVNFVVNVLTDCIEQF